VSLLPRQGLSDDATELDHGAQLLGFLEPVALGIDLDHLGAVHEPVDECDDARGVREDLAQSAKALFVLSSSGLCAA
jgi:hypothetical protein